MRLIIDAEPADYVFALKCAQWMIDNPESKDAILVFTEVAMGTAGKAETVFYVKRNKSSISVRYAQTLSPRPNVSVADAPFQLPADA